MRARSKSRSYVQYEEGKRKMRWLKETPISHGPHSSDGKMMWPALLVETACCSISRFFELCCYAIISFQNQKISSFGQW